jgi:hypothetical protein
VAERSSPALGEVKLSWQDSVPSVRNDLLDSRGPGSRIFHSGGEGRCLVKRLCPVGLQEVSDKEVELPLSFGQAEGSRDYLG